jgi:multicomponent Na+:H+ antiporter subunit F
MTTFLLTMNALMLIIVLSLCATIWRLLRGPSIPDRVVALDMIIIHLVGLIALFVVISGQLVLLDAVIVVAVLSFLGTVAIARFIEEGKS